MPHGGRLQIQLKKVTLRETDDSHSNGRPDQQSLPAGEYLELSLEDTGCGMSKEVLSRIFEPFFTTRKFGSGMGLAASHGIIRSHGGDIRIRSEPKLGTSVKIYLPAAGNASAETLAEPASCPQLQGSESILVVDDEETVAAMIAKTLTRFGYRVTVHTSSTEALKAFQDSPEKWDLAVLDEIMPDLTGDRLAEQMSRIRPRFPIILCSGFSRIPSVEKMKEFGIRKFITKPILDDKLMREIRHLLDESKRDKPLSSVKA
jgi:CheY-like chemotaxis protein